MSGTYNYLNAYLTEINFIDGQALTPSYFGETDAITGRWKAKAYSGTYGTNGFYLKFADNSGTTATTLGKDSSGNGNNWTPNNFSVSSGVGNDSLTDSPANYGTISTTLTDDTYQISRSLRFNSADSAYLSRTPASAGNRKTWTWSGWVKRTALSPATVGVFEAASNASNRSVLFFTSTDTLSFFENSSGSTVTNIATNQVFRDFSSWSHIIISVDTTQSVSSERVKLYHNGTQITSFASSTYPSQNFDTQVNSTVASVIGAGTAYTPSAFINGYLTEIHFIDGQALTPDSFGVRDSNYLWKPKAYTGTYGTNGFYLNFSDNSGTTATTLGKDQAGSNNWTPVNFSVASGVGNDSLVDTPTYYGTDSGAGGEARGDYATLDPLASIGGSASISNGNLEFSRGATIYSGARANYPIPSTGKYYFEVTGVTASSMTIGFANELFTYGGTNRLAYDGSGVKINKAGTNSSYGASFSGTDIVGVAVNADAKEITFYKNGASQGLAFSGSDYTGFGQLYPYAQINDGTNTTAAFNFGQRPFAYTAPSGFRALRDYNKIPVPTGGVVRGNYCTLNPLSVTNGSFVQGNLRYTGPSNWKRANGTISVSTGKWYYEVTLGNAPAPTRNSSSGYNAFGFGEASIFNSAIGFGSITDGIVLGDSGFYKNFSSSNTDGGTAFSSGDVLSIAVDLGANTFTFYRNNSQLVTGTIGGNAGRELVPIIISYDGSFGVMDVNFGQRPWAYDAPFGFLPLCTALLPTPTIKKPSSYMDVVTYTGTGATQTISGLGFSPDLLWTKGRSLAQNHNIFDTQRSGQRLRSDTTGAEASTTVTLGSNGFTLGTETENNNSGSTFVAWAWDEAPIAGMDIVAFTAPSGTSQSTVAHNLGVAPKMIIVKNRDTNANNWAVFHSSVCDTTSKFLQLNTTAALQTFSTVWGASLPTSSVFGVTGGGVAASGVNCIAYLFAEVEGFSKFGSYTGNGSADGPFVWCGFRPRYILFKCSSTTDNWYIRDTTRDTYNLGLNYLQANVANAEATSGGDLDYLSNGFKCRNSLGLNASGQTYIFAAFAESPFKYARAR